MRATTAGKDFDDIDPEFDDDQGAPIGHESWE